MTKHIVFHLLLLIGFLSSCQNEQVEPATPDAPARTAPEIKARLMAQSKWTINEAYANGTRFYKRGQTSAEVADIEVEWIRFTNDGRFEMKSFGDPAVEKFYYKVDEITSQLLVSEDDTFKQTENLTIKTGSVYAGTFDIEQQEGSETILLKMVPLP